MTGRRPQALRRFHCWSDELGGEGSPIGASCTRGCAIAGLHPMKPQLHPVFQPGSGAGLDALKRGKMKMYVRRRGLLMVAVSMAAGTGLPAHADNKEIAI